MKNLILTVIILYAWFQLPANTGEGNFVATSDQTIACKGLKMGFLNTRVTMPDGSIGRIPISQVKAYRLNGRQYERMPLVNSSGDTVTYTFMEFICSKNGCRLYRYCTNCNHYDPLNDEIAPINYLYRYYIFSGGKLTLVNEKEELALTMASFGVKMLA